MSIEFPGEDSITADGWVAYCAFVLGNSSSYIYDIDRDLEIMQDRYFSFVSIEDMLMAQNVTRDKANYEYYTVVDAFQFSQGMLKFCETDTLDIWTKANYFNEKMILNYSNQITSLHWISKNVIAYEADGILKLISYKQKVRCFLPDIFSINTGADSLILFSSFRYLFITKKDGNYCLWLEDYLYGKDMITPYLVESIVLRNYILKQNQNNYTSKLLIIEINNEKTIYVHHDEDRPNYYVSYKEGIYPPDHWINLKTNSLGPITEELILGD